MIKRTIKLSLATIITGIILTGYGLINDPFSIPFQDYDLMPTAQKNLYEETSHNMKILIRYGALISISGFIVLAACLIKKKKRK